MADRGELEVAAKANATATFLRNLQRERRDSGPGLTVEIVRVLEECGRTIEELHGRAYFTIRIPGWLRGSRERS